MMNRSIRLMPGPWRTGPPPVRTAAAVAVLALLTACSGSPSATGSGGSSNAGGSPSLPSAISYSQCMRSHGVPDFPDPSGNGQVPKASTRQLGVSSPRLQAAQTACQHLYPGNGGSAGVLTKDAISQCEETGDCPQALVQQAMTALRAYARCMRSHGVPDWPDPTIDSEGRPEVNLVPVAGTNWNSARISNLMHECQHVMPNDVPVPVEAPGVPG
jgi:hypothetical protein